MTHPIERASVEQADRDFAAFWILISLQNAKLVREGKWDHHEGVQATARHRQQARDAGFAEGVERAAEAAQIAASKRARIYLDKQEESDPAAPDDCNRWDRMADHAEAVRLTGVETISAIEALSAEANEGRCDG